MDRFLQQTAAERARLWLPVVSAALLASLVVSNSVGVPISAPVIATNAVVLALAAVLWLLLRSELATRHAHLLAAATTLLAPTTTLVTQWDTGVANLAMLILIELGGSAVQVSTRYMVATTLAIVAAWLPLGLRDGGEAASFHITVVVAGAIVAVATHVLLRRSLVRAEHQRIERKRAETDREQLREQFIHAQRMEAVGTLAAGLAHDMNNILGGILGYAEMLCEDAPDDRTREDCTTIVEAAQRGAELTRALLAFSRRGQYRRKPVALRQVLDRIGPLLSRTLPKSITIERTIECDVVIDADETQLGQALMNLCINGADAMDGAGQLALHCTSELLAPATCARLGLRITSDPYAVVSVRDTGCGMDDETRRRIFEPFFTTKPQGKGTGLGLAMVYGAIQGHGGAIDVETAPDAGTRFRIYLPTVDAIPIATPARADSGRLRRRHVVMVVDDEPVVRTAACRILERIGVVVVSASDGEEAVRLFEERQREVALVILDMAMPNMGGAECFHALQRRAHVPVLIASGYALDRDAQALLSEGAIGFLEKPFSAATLCEHVERALTRRVAATAAAQ
jgi:signal transduction histidine kinase/CheY-like chemotaxis protein